MKFFLILCFSLISFISFSQKKEEYCLVDTYKQNKDSTITLIKQSKNSVYYTRDSLSLSIVYIDKTVIGSIKDTIKQEDKVIYVCIDPVSSMFFVTEYLYNKDVILMYRKNDEIFVEFFSK